METKSTDQNLVQIFPWSTTHLFLLSNYTFLYFNIYQMRAVFIHNNVVASESDFIF
jgi:hypothetical protein